MATAEKNYLNNLFDEVKKENLKVKNFLDIGCYRGENTVLLAKACSAKNIYGIDFNKTAMKEAAAKGIKVIFSRYQ